MKKITIKNKSIGTGIKFLGWSGRGWADGGPVGAGPMNSRAPSWDSYSQEIGINMVRMGFSMKHFISEETNIKNSLSDQVRKGLENTEVSWAKSENTSYSYAIQRCFDLDWKILICINPSYSSGWTPSLVKQSSPFLALWKDFCFHLAGIIEEKWPGKAEYFEVTNEPDIGYFNGESFLPNYHGPSGGITPFQYSLLLKHAYEGIHKAVPHVKVLGPGLASWNRNWLKEVLTQSSPHLDGVSYHNVGGHLKDTEIVKDAKQLVSKYVPQAEDFIFNSEWAWWPNHDINCLETALRIAQILYHQTTGNTYGSLYLGPAQPKGFQKGLGILQFDPDNLNSVEKTKSFFAFRLMARGVLGGELLELITPFNKLKTLALFNSRKELVITAINPSQKKLKNISFDIDETIPFKDKPFLNTYQFDYNHSDSCERSDWKILKRFCVSPQSIIQFVIPISRQD